MCLKEGVSVGRSATFLAIFIIQVLTFAYMATVGNYMLLLGCVSIVALCYGGGFGTMPAYAADVFGPENAGTIYGAMLTAWSAGAIIGPVLITSVPSRTALVVIAAILVAGAVVTLVADANVRRTALARS